MGPLDAWLAARDADALDLAWTALGARVIDVAEPSTYLSEQGAVRLAAEFLGWPSEAVAWIAQGDRALPPDAPVQRLHRPAARSFLELAFDVRESCDETWALVEKRDGARGLQRLEVGFGIDDGSREGVGSGGTVLRVFDLAAGLAVSVPLCGRQAGLVAPDAEALARLEARARAALDLRGFNRTVRVRAWPRYDRARMRSLVATLAAAADGAFAASAAWAGGCTVERPDPDPDSSVAIAHWRYADPGDATRAVRLREFSMVDRHGKNLLSVSAEIDGLAPGESLSLSGDFGDAEDLDVSLRLILPRAGLDAVDAAVKRLEGV